MWLVEGSEICHRALVARSMDCFANARNDEKYLLSTHLPKIRARKDGNRHSEGGARRIFFNKRSFAIAQLCIQAHTSSLRCGGSLCKNDKKKAAFTLAEVLITLGVIGIVAAMTLPTLIASYQKKVVETRLISFYSKINQAYRMSYAENGDTVYWVDTNKTYSYNEMLAWLEQYLFPYMKHYNVKKCVSNIGQVGVCVTIPDGSLYWFSIDGNGQDVSYYINGNFNDKNIRNRFAFNFSKRIKDNYYDNRKQSINFVDPYVFNWDGRRESLFTNGTWGCRKGCTNCAYCTKLIQLNGWEIPDDFPW